MAAYRARVNLAFVGSIEKGDELYHEVRLYEGEQYEISLEADDKDVDLDFYITDKAGNIIYQDEGEESDAAAIFSCATTATFSFFVKAVDGDTDYTLSVNEKEE